MAGNELSAEVDNFANDVRMIRIVFTFAATYKVHASHLKTSETLTDLVAAKDSKGTHDDVEIHPSIRYYEYFNRYVNWVYKDYFSTNESAGPLALISDGLTVQENFNYLKDLYLLALELRDSTVQDAVVDAFIAKFEKPGLATSYALPRADIVRELCERTSDTDPCRRLLVTVFARQAPADAMTTTTLIPSSFVREVAAQMASERAPTQVVIANCVYHDHFCVEVCDVSRKRKRA